MRHVVNARRNRVHQGYDGDETLLRHKARLAQALLNNDDRKPDGMDFKLLQVFADAHAMSLVEAARLVLGTLNEAESILMGTEMIKDRLRARIEAVATLRDVQRVSKNLDDLANRRDPVAVT